MADRVKQLDEKQTELENQIEKFMLALPNLPAEDVVAGGKENNQVVYTFGEKPHLPYEGKNHVDLCTSLGLIDYERGVKMGGNGYWLYTGLGAQLEWALLNYFISTHIKDGYEFMLPPHMLTYECGLTAGPVPQVRGRRVPPERGGLPLHAAHRRDGAHQPLPRRDTRTRACCPRKLFAYTPCYRREAGTYRASERGMIRGHQFNKVEMFGYTKPEDSDAMLEELIRKACAAGRGSGPALTASSKLAAGDCSASMATTYDVELWLPSMNEYKECSLGIQRTRLSGAPRQHPLPPRGY